MADLTNKKRRRTAQRNSVLKLMKRFDELIISETLNNDEKEEINSLRNTIKGKEIIIKDIDNFILDSLPEEEIDADIESSTVFELNIKLMEEKMKRIVTVEGSRIILPSTGSTTSETKSNVKLPKLDLKKFDGEPTEWQSFFEMFLSAVDSNDNLSNVEKFTYLKSYLEKEATRTIQGLA